MLATSGACLPPLQTAKSISGAEFHAQPKFDPIYFESKPFCTGVDFHPLTNDSALRTYQSWCKGQVEEAVHNQTPDGHDPLQVFRAASIEEVGPCPISTEGFTLMHESK